MIKTELRGKFVGILMIALIVTSVFSGAVSARDIVASSNRAPDNSAEGNYCNESTAKNAVTANLNLSERIDELLEKGKLPFLFFYADWCGFCEKQKPIIEELEREYADSIEFIWLNVDEYREEAQEFGVNGYPTMFLIVGKEDDRYLYQKFGGYTEKDKLAEELDRVMETGTADNVRGTSFDEDRRSNLECSSCGNLSDFNLSITQENLTLDEFFKEISNDSESLELYNRANELGYTKIKGSQMIIVNNETVAFIGILTSQDSDNEISLVKFSSGYSIKPYLIKLENTGITVIDNNGSETYDLDVLSQSSSQSFISPKMLAFGACIAGFESVPDPIEYAKDLIISGVCAEACKICGLTLEVAPLNPACYICAPCFGSKIGKTARCCLDAYDCNFPDEICKMVKKDPYLENDVCYYDTYATPFSEDCCGYGGEADLSVCKGRCIGDMYEEGEPVCKKEDGKVVAECKVLSSTPADEYCREKDYEKGQCGEPISPYCGEDEPIPDKIKSFSGDLWCWNCALDYGQECIKDSDCSVNLLGHYCAPSCTEGGASHCCPTGQFWSEADQECVNKCECSVTSDCPICHVCIGGKCEVDDSAISDELKNLGYICCDGRLYEPSNMPACCDDEDCNTTTGEVCHNYLCAKTQGACYYHEDCAPGYDCQACEGKQTHCCPEGMKWAGTKCVVDCYVTCPPRKCMQDWAGNEYSCRLCTEEEISQSLCKETSGGCFYGDPGATNSPCERCVGEDCVNGYCEGSVGCAEYKLPADHGSIWCDDVTILCNCPSTCSGALRLYDPMNFILPGDAGYLYGGCIYHGCYNCGADDLICRNGNCISGDPPGNFICDSDQCTPDTVIFWNDYARTKSGPKCFLTINDYKQKCAPSSQRYTFAGEFCTDETGVNYPYQINEHLWKAKISYKKMRDYTDEIREPICYEEKDWGCYENDDRRFKLYECIAPVPANYWICRYKCYDPEYYECCGGGWLVLKDQDGDGIQDHQCCIEQIKERDCIDPNQDGKWVKKNVIEYDCWGVDIMNDPQNCGGCGWTCTDVVNGACMNVERDYSHVCTGTKPQCCRGTCIEPSPVLNIKELTFYPDNVIENAEKTIVVTVDYADPYNYGKNVDINLTLYIDNSSVGFHSLSLHPGTAKTAYFFWRANLSIGEHELKATIDLINNITICGDLEQKKVFTVHQKPDIMVENFVFDIIGAKSGDIVPITAALRNLGESDAIEFVTCLSVDGTFQTCNITSIFAGENQEIPFNWTALLGEHNLTITADSLPVPDGLIPETNEFNNSASQAVNILIKGNTAPVLTYTFESGYFFDGVEPDTGDESTIFEYRVKYMDYDNDPPASGHPKLWIDVNGDGDYGDVIDGFAEGNFEMNEVNVSDTIYSDGKLYSYATSLPCGANHTYKFSAIDGTGMNATGNVDVNNGPFVEHVSSMPDIVIADNWVKWPDNCTICYNVTNIGNGTALAGHNTTLYVDGIEVAHDHVPVVLAPRDSHIGCFDDYTWTYTPPEDDITVCADNNNTVDESNETNNCLENIWMCGDVNGDRTVNVVDVLHVYRRALDSGYPLELPWAADVNRDGNINVVDVLHVYRRALDPIYDLNCCCEV